MKISEIISKWYRHNKNFLSELWINRKIDRALRNTQIDRLYDDVHNKSQPCFVLSTGRCGTKLLTRIIEHHDNLAAFHKPNPELTYYSHFAYEHAFDKPELLKHIIDACRYEALRDMYIADLQYIETNNRITFFAYALLELFPNAKFIHLIRNPADFIISGYNRMWYSNTQLYDEARISPIENSAIFDSYSQPEKIAWLWNATNQFIHDFKPSVPDDKIITIKAEDLFKEVKTSIRILNFLGVDSGSKKKISSLISRKVNKQEKDKSIDKDKLVEIIQDLAPVKNKYY